MRISVAERERHRANLKAVSDDPKKWQAYCDLSDDIANAERVLEKFHQMPAGMLSAILWKYSMIPMIVRERRSKAQKLAAKKRKRKVE